MVVSLPLPVLERLAEPALGVVTEYLERRSYLGVFVLLFLGAFGPSPPEEIVLLIAGFMVFQGIARFPLMVGVSLAGIVVSDSILYGFGVLFGGTLERHKVLKKIFPPKKVEKIKTSFRKYRYRFLFLARYLYGLRPVVFFTAGTARMPFGRFLVTDLVASLVNCVLWTSLGVLFGSRIEDAIRFARRSEIILLGLVIALILYFVVETLLVKREVVSPRSFWIRQATGTKIAAVVATVLLAVLVGRFLFPHGVGHALHWKR
jgi:membrane protein DedA with SNARE-associated domain